MPTTTTDAALAVSAHATTAEIAKPLPITPECLATTIEALPGPLDKEIWKQTFPKEKLAARRSAYCVAIGALIAMVASVLMTKFALDGVAMPNLFRWVLAVALVFGVVGSISVFLHCFKKSDPVLATIAALACLALISTNLGFSRARVVMLIDGVTAGKNTGVEWSDDTQDQPSSKPDPAIMLLVEILSWAIPLFGLGLELAEGVGAHYAFHTINDPDLLAYFEMKRLGGHSRWNKEKLFAVIFPLLLLILLLLAMSRNVSAAALGTESTVVLVDVNTTPEALRDNGRFARELLAQAPVGARQLVLGITDDAFSHRQLLLDGTVRADTVWLADRGRQQLQKRLTERLTRIHFTGCDILGAVAMAKEVASISATQPARLILLTGGHNTKSVDFDQSDPNAIRAQLLRLAERGSIPDLRGTRVYMLGIDPGSSQKQYFALKNAWMEFFHLAGARLMAFSVARNLGDLQSTTPVSISPAPLRDLDTSDKAPIPSFQPAKSPQQARTAKEFSGIQVRVMRPTSDGTVETESLVSGSVSDASAEVWPIVCVDGDRCWTQRKATVSDTGRWESTAYFGRGPADSGKPFTVYAVVNPTDRLFEGKVLDAVPAGICSEPVHVTVR
jgi:hypothetical protein